MSLSVTYRDSSIYLLMLLSVASSEILTPFHKFCTPGLSQHSVWQQRLWVDFNSGVIMISLRMQWLKYWINNSFENHKPKTSRRLAPQHFTLWRRYSLPALVCHSHYIYTSLPALVSYSHFMYNSLPAMVGHSHYMYTSLPALVDDSHTLLVICVRPVAEIALPFHNYMSTCYILYLPPTIVFQLVQIAAPPLHLGRLHQVGV